MVLWGSALAATTSPSRESGTDDVVALEAYKRRLITLEAEHQAQGDSNRARQLRQMRQLLGLMQQSIVDASVDSEPKPTPPPPQTTPPPATLPASAPPTVTEASSSSEPTHPSLPVVSPTHEVPLAEHSPTPSPKAPPLEGPSSAELSSAPPVFEIPKWFFQLEVAAAVGYQDNLLRSAFSNLDSTLIHAEADLHILNTQRDDVRLLALGHASWTHFLDEPDVRDEDLFFVLGEGEKRLGEHWWLGLNTSFFSAHQPFDDPDILDLDTTSAPLRFRQWSLAPQLRWEPSQVHQWQVRGGVRYEDTKGVISESQDNRQGFFSLGYTFEPVQAHRWKLDYHFTRADYDERLSRSPDGQALADALDLTTHEWQVAYRRSGKWLGRAWHIEPRMRVLLDQDDEGGYDDATRVEWRVKAGLHQAKGLRLEGDLRYGHYFYDSRQVSEVDDSRRERSYWAGAFSLEQRWNDHAAIWLEYEFRDNLGNRSSDDYTVHTLYTGIRLRF